MICPLRDLLHAAWCDANAEQGASRAPGEQSRQSCLGGSYPSQKGSLRASPGSSGNDGALYFNGTINLEILQHFKEEASYFTLTVFLLG